MTWHRIRGLQARYRPPTLLFLLFMGGTTRLPTTITASVDMSLAKEAVHHWELSRTIRDRENPTRD